MELFSVILKFLFFFFVGTIISFFADNVGKRIGKKKVVLFNMRPKYTALLITSVAGGLIAVLSIIALSFLSRDARIYLFQIDEVVKQIDFYKNEVRILQDRYTEITRDISVLIQTTHMGDIIFLKDQPIYIFSFYNDGNKRYLYDAVDGLRKVVLNRYSNQLGSQSEVYLSNIIRIDQKNISDINRQIDRRRDKRLALIFTSKRNTFIGEYVDINIYQIEDRIIIPANTILSQVDIYDTQDIEGNFTLIMQTISEIQDDLVKKGKLFLPQERSIGGEIPFGKIVGELIKIKESGYLTKNKRKFKVLLINQDDIYVAGKFRIILKTIEE
ncbi:MAG: DUF3084 domain-containing protein [bacterium]|nr:DUF3084 domain-containing protein [bacterium]